MIYRSYTRCTTSSTHKKKRHSQKEMKFFWIVIPLLFIGLCLLPRFGFRNRWMPAYDYAYQPGTPAQPSALDILNQRYARGEIDVLTYEQMRERLSNVDRPRE